MRFAVVDGGFVGLEGAEGGLGGRGGAVGVLGGGWGGGEGGVPEWVRLVGLLVSCGGLGFGGGLRRGGGGGGGRALLVFCGLVVGREGNDGEKFEFW